MQGPRQSVGRGPRGHDVVYQGHPPPLDMARFHVEHTLDVAPTVSPVCESGLGCLVPDPRHRPLINRNSQYLAKGPCELKALVEAPLSKPSMMQGHGYETITISGLRGIVS